MGSAGYRHPETKVKYTKPTQWYKLITVEPPMFLYMMAFMVTNVIEQSFYVHKACTVNNGYSVEICKNLSNLPEINVKVQVTVSNFHQWNGIAAHLVPLILAFFLGAWSDKRGRKSVLLAGCLGKLYFSIMMTINSIYTAWPLEYMLYTAAIPSAMTGADLAIFAGVFAYISDVTSMKNRTLRVGILDVAYLSTMPLGVALGAFLYSNVVNESYTIMFAINVTFMTLATLYVLLFLKWQTTPLQKSLKEAGIKNPISDFFDYKHVKSSFLTLMKKRSGHRRLFFWFLLLSMALYTFQRDERPMVYLYTSKVFGWGTVEFSNYRTYLSSMYVLVMIAGIPIMTKYLKWRDTAIIMIGASAHVLGHFIYAIAKVGWLMYVGATAAALGPCVAPLIRAMTSKLLEPSERGVAFAFLSVCENAVALFASILYTQIYNATISTNYSNSIFMMTIATQVIVFLFAFIMQIMLGKRHWEQYIQDETTHEDATAESSGKRNQTVNWIGTTSKQSYLTNSDINQAISSAVIYSVAYEDILLQQIWKEVMFHETTQQ